jgi:outer membrane protein assembly factor BamB
LAGFDVTPVVANDVVYLINQKGTVVAYSASSGAVQWERTDLVINSGLGFQLSTPVYNDGVLYAALLMGTGKGFGVFALDAADGHTIWSHQLLDGSNVQPNTPIVYDEGKIYLGCYFTTSTPGRYYCIDTTDGTITWERVATSSKSYYGTGAVIIGDYLVFGEDSGNVISVNKMTGVTMQEISAASTLGLSASIIRSSAAYSSTSGMVLFTTQSGYCCAIGFDASTGIFDTARKWATNIGYSTSTPAVYDGRVYVGAGTFTGSSNYLYCLSEDTGAQQWKLSVNGGVQSSPVISTHYDDGDGEVYIYFTTNSANGRAYCVDADGNVRWSYEPPAGQVQYIVQGVAIYEGKLFFGNDAGYIFALGGE